MRSFPIAAAVVLATGLALAGCTGTPEPVEPAGTPTAAPVEVTPELTAPVETGEPEVTEPAAPEGLTVGQVLTEVPGDLEPSQRAFPMPDGTFVLIDRYEPVPDAVKSVLNEQATASIPYDPNARDAASMNASDQGAVDFRSQVSLTTAKNVVVVFQVTGGGACDGSGVWGAWTYTNAAASFHGGCAGWGTREAAIAGAEQYVASKADPETYLIVAKNA